MKRPESRGDRAVALAAELLKLGISHKGVVELLSFPLDEVENQLAWLPYRKAKRPGAFVIDAIRHNYKPPKEAYYAADQIEATRVSLALDENSEHRH